jgi:hypothetical protein
MNSVLRRAGPLAQTNDPFVARYRGRYHGFYLVRTLPLFVLFAVLAVLYLDDDMRRLIFSRNTSSYKRFSWLELGFLLALVTAPLLDLALTLMRVRRGAVALSVSPEGITGSVSHMSRRFTWNDIADVAVDGKFLVVRRNAHTLLQILFAARGLGNINVPVQHLDCDVEDILAAVRRFAPTEHGRAVAS